MAKKQEEKPTPEWPEKEPATPLVDTHLGSAERRRLVVLVTSYCENKAKVKELEEESKELSKQIGELSKKTGEKRLDVMGIATVTQVHNERKSYPIDNIKLGMLQEGISKKQVDKILAGAEKVSVSDYALVTPVKEKAGE
jgi:hypothetical protein